MLVRVKAENIYSFRDPVELSLIASRERIHPAHVVDPVKGYQPRLLRAAVLYGANASGKSNLVRVISFARNLIVHGTDSGEEIPVKCFRLDQGCAERPSEFEFEFAVDDEVFIYGLRFRPKRILREWLSVLRTDYEREIFVRTTSEDDETSVDFGDFAKGLEDEDRQFLTFVARGTRPTQPFLTEAAERNVKLFESQMDWFRHTLSVISPEDPYSALEVRLDSDRSFADFFSEVLRAAGTEISRIQVDERDVESLSSVPDEMIEFATKHLDEDKIVFSRHPDGRRLAFVSREGKIFGIEISTAHERSDGSGVELFELTEESDGTQRLFDLIPTFHELVNSEVPRVVFIDEIGRSLHPHLVRMLLEIHLDHSAEGQRTQLIATTHDTTLIDLDLLRRDEIWFVEKDENQSSQLYSLHDFEPRYDKDVRKDYLLGRYGGIPFLGSASALRARSSS